MDDYDDYMLSPLAEVDDDVDPTAATAAAEMENDDDDNDDTVAAAEDYVQSLVTIESNWENGRTFFSVVLGWYFFHLDIDKLSELRFHLDIVGQCNDNVYLEIVFSFSKG